MVKVSPSVTDNTSALKGVAAKRGAENTKSNIKESSSNFVLLIIESLSSILK
jgi:hypothetical protein